MTTLHPTHAADDVDDSLPHALLLAAIEALGGAALVLDDTLRVAGATAAAERLLGTRVPPGKHAAKLLHGDDAERPIAEALVAGRPVMATIRRLRRDGSERLVLVRARPLRTVDGRAGWILLLSEEATWPDDRPEQLHSMWTRDPTVKRLFRLAEKVAHCDASVLIQGEMGTGKASFAAAIHALSPRHAGPFHALTCAGMPPAELRRTLVGNSRGADEGTLFLHDVEQLPPETQAELLAILESGAVTPPDGGPPVAIDLRVIASTHTSLPREVERGGFRADLMYRLRIVSLHLPPLRARRGDISLLADKLVADLNQRGGRRIERIAPAAAARLENHPFPGNVRELRAAIESAFATGEGPVLLPAELPPDVGEPLTSTEIPVLPAPPSQPPLAGEIDDAARIRRALELAGGDRVQAAAMVGMSRTTLWRRMRSLGLLDPGDDQ